jgi:hypothetical protein
LGFCDKEKEKDSESHHHVSATKDAEEANGWEGGGPTVATAPGVDNAFEHWSSGSTPPNRRLCITGLTAESIPRLWIYPRIIAPPADYDHCRCGGFAC